MCWLLSELQLAPASLVAVRQFVFPCLLSEAYFRRQLCLTAVAEVDASVSIGAETAHTENVFAITVNVFLYFSV